MFLYLGNMYVLVISLLNKINQVRLGKRFPYFTTCLFVFIFSGLARNYNGGSLGTNSNLCTGNLHTRANQPPPPPPQLQCCVRVPRMLRSPLCVFVVGGGGGGGG